MINNRYYLTSMWGRGLGVSLVNTEERRGLAYLEVTSSIMWVVWSPQRDINNGIKTEPKIRTVSPTTLRGSAVCTHVQMQDINKERKKYSVGVIIMKFMYFNFV